MRLPEQAISPSSVMDGVRFPSLKSIFDLALASLTLLMVSPLLTLIAILVKIDSSGPVFFKQPRVGLKGRPFQMLKFRTMSEAADPETHRAHVTRLILEKTDLQEAQNNGQKSLKFENDPRVTWVGNFLRKTSLDELPQLINVIRGEMSLVGPRPHLPYEVELYEDWHRQRLQVLPGITGLWQVKGRNQVNFDEMIRMDIDYIGHRSLWLDIKILLKTPFAALRGQGAG